MTDDLPTAVPDTSRMQPRGRWLWLFPVVAALMVGYGVVTAFIGRGPEIIILVPDAHGLKPGAAIKHRGMEVGVVETLRLADDGVEIQARLEPTAADLARAATRFWIERPIVGADGVSGMSTLLGGSHVGVLPGGGRREKRFQGLELPPARTPDLANGLELVLEAPRRGGLVQGAPVLYRQITVGKVVAVNLASDGKAVKVHVVIAHRFVELVRNRSRFWLVSGVDVEAGLFSGVKLSVDSLAALVQGGVAFATPEDAGEVVATGHRFTLAAQAEEEWLQWSPSLAVGERLPGGLGLPRVERVAATWQVGTLWRRERRSSAWALPVPGGLLLPGDVLEPLVADQSSIIEVAGERIGLEMTKEDIQAVSFVPTERAMATIALDRLRVPNEIGDILLVCGDREPLAFAGERLIAEQGRWTIPAGPVVDASWHGAVVVSRFDGAIVGMVLVRRAKSVIVPIDPRMVVAKSEAETAD